MNGAALSAFDEVMSVAWRVVTEPMPLREEIVEELGAALCALEALENETEATMAESAFGLAACLVTENPDSPDAVRALHHTRMVVLRERAREKRDNTPAEKLYDWQRRKDTGG